MQHDFARSITDAMEFVMRSCTDVNQDDHIHLDLWHVFYQKMTQWSAGKTPPATVEACMLIAASNFDIKVLSLCLFCLNLVLVVDVLPCPGSILEAPCVAYSLVPNEHYQNSSFDVLIILMLSDEYLRLRLDYCNFYPKLTNKCSHLDM